MTLEVLVGAIMTKAIFSSMITASSKTIRFTIGAIGPLQLELVMGVGEFFLAFWFLGLLGL